MKNRSHRDRKETTAKPDLENGRGKQPRSHEKKRAKGLRGKIRQEDWGANQPLGSQLALSHQLLPESFPLVCVIPIPPPGGELQPFNLPLSPLPPRRGETKEGGPRRGGQRKGR